jgi:hypothetical protein
MHLDAASRLSVCKSIIQPAGDNLAEDFASYDLARDELKNSRAKGGK